jgi:inosine-uridine nucleoside N-ribohydrolase
VSEPAPAGAPAWNPKPEYSAERPALLIDCDPGHDDALALLVAARHTEVVGITTVAGNAPLHHTTRNALAIAELVGIDAPIHAGADRPLVAPPRHGERIHGDTGLDGPEPIEPRRAPDGHDAAAFIVDTVRQREGIWLVPTGPLTNIALSLRRAPDLVDRIAGISLMGGSAGAGNVTATAEFNIWADPEAAAVVLGCGARPLLMSGLNLTRQFTLDDEFVASLDPAVARGHRLARFCADLLAFYLDRQAQVTGRRAGPAHDVCAVLGVSHPELVRYETRRVEVELRGDQTRGMTVVDERAYPGDTQAHNVEVGYQIDALAARHLLTEAILS